MGCDPSSLRDFVSAEFPEQESAQTQIARLLKSRSLKVASYEKQKSGTFDATRAG